MDVDEQPAAPGQPEDAGLALPNGDHSRFPDTASTPGSTAQSAATPAVHEASTDTSPDNEGVQYVEREDEKTEPQEPENASEVPERPGQPEPSEDGEGSGDSVTGAAGGVEAQLLEESASAQLSHSAVSSEPPAATAPAGVPNGILKQENADAEVDVGIKIRQDSHASEVAHPPAGQANGAEAQPLGRKEASLDSHPKPPQENHVGDIITPVETPSVTKPPPPAGPTRLPEADITPATKLPSVESAVSSVPSVPLTPQRPTNDPSDELMSSANAPASIDRTEMLEEDDLEPTTPLSMHRLKALGNKSRDKRRRSVPTVVFGKQQKKPEDSGPLVQGKPKPGQLPTEDYFTPLFIEGFTRNSLWMKPIEHLLNQAHKTVSTSDQFISVLDHQACRILRRVYHLQQHDKWSLRQPMRCPEPTRSPSHMDLLLQEMKWMRTDFREERKWKRAVAQNLAYACAEWVASPSEVRKALQVNAVIPPILKTPTGDVDMTGTADGAEESLPDLVHSDSPMGIEEELSDPPVEFIAPSALFALQDDEVVFGLRRSRAADQLLEELPLYGAPLKVPKSDLTGPEFDPDAHWRRPAVPLSKYVEGQMTIVNKSSPRKRGRYEYNLEDSDSDEGVVVFGSEQDAQGRVVPESNDVALFTAEMKPIRDRLHAGHQFRPPTEYPMPLQSFYESRVGSQWTIAEDDELKSFVRDYSYNWSLISDMISTKSCFASSTERRTPWECFERWVHLEGLPNDMAKTQYFKTYNNRIDSAQRAITQQNQIAAQQVSSGGAVTPIPRKRQTTTVRVERRRNQKHLALIDAMRKLAKKRETVAQKAQQAAALAAGRKPAEPRQQTGTSNKTPRELSQMRAERDQQFAERMAQYAQRQQEAYRQKVRSVHGFSLSGACDANAFVSFPRHKLCSRPDKAMQLRSLLRQLRRKLRKLHRRLLRRWPPRTQPPTQPVSTRPTNWPSPGRIGLNPGCLCRHRLTPWSAPKHRFPMASCPPLFRWLPSRRPSCKPPCRLSREWHYRRRSRI